MREMSQIVLFICKASGSHVAGCFGGADGPPDPGLTAVAGEASRARKRGVRAQRKDLRSGVRLRSSPIYFAAQHEPGTLVKQRH